MILHQLGSNVFAYNCKNNVKKARLIVSYLWQVFFLPGFSFTDTEDSQNSKGKVGVIFCSTLPFPAAHKHWNIYLKLCMRDAYHLFLIAALVFTRLLLDETYHLIELPFGWLIDYTMFVCLLDELILGFCYSELTWETGGFELASTMSLVLQTNRLISVLLKCNSAGSVILECS